MSLLDHKDIEIAKLKAEIEALKLGNTDLMRFLKQAFITPELEKKFRAGPFIIELSCEPLMIARLKELGIGQTNSSPLFIMSPISGTKEYKTDIKGVNSSIDVSEERTSIYLGNNRYKVKFLMQNCCKVGGIEMRLPPHYVSGSLQFRYCINFILPIIDRIITVESIRGELKSVQPVPIYYESVVKKEMILPINGIFWDLQYWDVKQITLWSEDRINVKMTIEHTYDLTDEELVRIIY